MTGNGSSNAQSGKRKGRRVKKYMSKGEVTRLIEAAREGRHGQRDALLVLMCFNHGLRISEALQIRVEHIKKRLEVGRLKGGLSMKHDIPDRERTALDDYLKTQDLEDSDHLFQSERGKVMHRNAAAYIIAQAGKRAKLGHVHPHMLRHACANEILVEKKKGLAFGKTYLGHVSIASTMVYCDPSEDAVNDEIAGTFD